MTIGSYSYGLRMRWGRCDCTNLGKLGGSQACCELLPTCTLGPIKLSKHDISVIKLRNGACKGFGVMPGYYTPSFLSALCCAVYRSFDYRFNPKARTVTPGLYSLWSLSCEITTELFADAFNESGVLNSYCSLDKMDSAFGSIGNWEAIEEVVEGAGGNPPFDKSFLHKMVTEFDKGARGTTPYCRCVILPLGKSYNLKQRTASISSKAFMLVHIPPGCLPFMRQEIYFSYAARPNYNQFQELGLFVWLNREYLEKYPPPRDVEVLYLHWISKACLNSSQVKLNLPAFSEAFPITLRKPSRSIDDFNLL